jgi:hypothetical protein
MALEPTQIPSQWAPEAILEVKQIGRKADHLSSYIAEVKKEWSYTSTPPYSFVACAGKNVILI